MLRRRSMPPLGPVEHRGPDVVARASGHTLVLWGASEHRALPHGVSTCTHLAADPDLESVFDCIVSVGQLGTADDLQELLARLRRHMTAATVLHFCEPTIASDAPTTAPPHDVTGALWASGFTVFECRRYRARHRARMHEYCWGRARLTPLLGQ